jgi:hypothetical protein
MLKNRGEVPTSQLHVEAECMAEGHITSKLVGRILSCIDCMMDNFLTKPLDFQDVLNLASGHNIQAMSFFDDSQPLSEDEFNELVKVYRAQHQDPDDYKTGKLSYLNLKWKCLECDRIFERTYGNIRWSKAKHYCPSCVSSIGSQITLENTEEAFLDYTTQPFSSNVQLYKFVPKRILLMNKYQVISHANVHVDIYGVISVAGKEFKIAIEHQGPQHYSFKAFFALSKNRDLKAGIYRTNEEYRDLYDALIERDRAKVELFKDLKKDGYYLIVVPHWISPAKRKSFILQEFIKQTDINPGQASIIDYL